MGISKYTMHRIMKSAAGTRVSLEAADLAAKYVTLVAARLALHAAKVARESGRVVVRKRDVAVVLEIMGVDVDRLEKGELDPRTGYGLDFSGEE